MKTLKIIGGLLLVIALIIGLTVKLREKHEERKRIESVTKGKTESKEATWVWVVTRTQTISINNEYSSIYYLSKGEGLSLKNSTQPYCVKNENSHCKCGEKGEDVTPKLPREDKNMELRFRTSNGEYGEITLVYWEEIIASNK